MRYDIRAEPAVASPSMRWVPTAPNSDGMVTPLLADIALELERAVADHRIAADERRLDLDPLTASERSGGTVPATHHADIDLPAAADAAERDVAADLSGVLAGAETAGR